MAVFYIDSCNEIVMIFEKKQLRSEKDYKEKWEPASRSTIESGYLAYAPDGSTTATCALDNGLTDSPRVYYCLHP